MQAPPVVLVCGAASCPASKAAAIRDRLLKLPPETTVLVIGDVEARSKKGRPELSPRRWAPSLIFRENPERWARETGTSARNVAQYRHDDPGGSFEIARRATSAYRASDAAQSKDFLDPDRKDA